MKKAILALGASLILSTGPTAAYAAPNPQAQAFGSVPQPQTYTASYAEDRAEIEDLSAKYMMAFAAGDLDTYVSCFTEDGVLDWTHGVLHGRAEIRKSLTPDADSKHIAADATDRKVHYHAILTEHIVVHGNTATQIAFWIEYSKPRPGTTASGVDPVFGNFGHYEDTLVKQNGHWLFSKRIVYNEFATNKKLFYPAMGENDPRLPVN